MSLLPLRGAIAYNKPELENLFATKNPKGATSVFSVTCFSLLSLAKKTFYANKLMRY